MASPGNRQATAALGAETFQAEFNAGTHLSRDAARRLALGEAAKAAVPASGGRRAGVLGKREADVARLVADGLSNKQIGMRLFISDRTVESHVRSILNKHGLQLTGTDRQLDVVVESGAFLSSHSH